MPSPRFPVDSKVTDLSLIVRDLHQGAGRHGPDIAVIAPGKPAKTLLKLRFSCMRMTTCWIEWFGGGAVGGGVTALVLLQPVSAAVSNSGRVHDPLHSTVLGF